MALSNDVTRRFLDIKDLKGKFCLVQYMYMVYEVNGTNVTQIECLFLGFFYTVVSAARTSKLHFVSTQGCLLCIQMNNLKKNNCMLFEYLLRFSEVRTTLKSEMAVTYYYVANAMT